MTNTCNVLLAWVLLSSFVAADDAPRSPALKGLDPVSLVAGKEEPGKAELALDHGRFRYLFATEANRRVFLLSPEKFAIQFSGACAKMGPLTGQGSPDRFSVHDAKIYIFASDSCLATFLKNPQRHVEPAEPEWKPTPEEAAQGRELIDLAVRGLGGEKKVDGVRSFWLEVKQTLQSGDKKTDHVARWIWERPDRCLRVQRWDDFELREVVAGEKGFYAGPTTGSDYDAFERHYLEQEFLRTPLILLAKRSEAGFQAASAGRQRQGDGEVELLRIRHGGVTTTLGIEPATGRILSARYQGRVGGFVGDVVKTYSDFRDVNGIPLPHRYSVSRDGELLIDGREYAAVKVNAEVPAESFDPPTRN